MNSTTGDPMTKQTCARCGHEERHHEIVGPSHHCLACAEVSECMGPGWAHCRCCFDFTPEEAQL